MRINTVANRGALSLLDEEAPIQVFKMSSGLDLIDNLQGSRSPLP